MANNNEKNLLNNLPSIKKTNGITSYHVTDKSIFNDDKFYKDIINKMNDDNEDAITFNFGDPNWDPDSPEEIKKFNTCLKDLKN